MSAEEDPWGWEQGREQPCVDPRLLHTRERRELCSGERTGRTLRRGLLGIVEDCRRKEALLEE